MGEPQQKKKTKKKPKVRKPKGRTSARKGEDFRRDAERENAKAQVEGRPTLYSDELALTILMRISQGESLLSVCKDKDMPARSTVYLWRLGESGAPGDFSDKYTRAREIQAEHLFDEIIDISDDGSNDYMTITKGDNEYNVEDREVTNRSKLRVETRKWYISKVVPKLYGDKVDITSDNEKITGNSIVIVDFDEPTPEDK